MSQSALHFLFSAGQIPKRKITHAPVWKVFKLEDCGVGAQGEEEVWPLCIWCVNIHLTHLCSDTSYFQLGLRHASLEILFYSDQRVNFQFLKQSCPELGCLPCGRLGFNPWVRKISCRRKWQPIPVLLPGKSHGQRNLVGYSPWGRKESDTTEWLHFYLRERKWSRSLQGVLLGLYHCLLALHTFFLQKCFHPIFQESGLNLKFLSAFVVFSRALGID